MSGAPRSRAMVLALLALWFLFWVLDENGRYVTAENFGNLARQIVVIGILALGMMLVIVAAQIDLSVGSAVGLTGAVTALVATGGAGTAAGVGAGLLTGLVAGAAMGWLVARHGVASFVVTLGGLMVFRGLNVALLDERVMVGGPFLDGLGTGTLDGAGGWIAGAALALVLAALARGADDHARAVGARGWLAPGVAALVTLGVAAWLLRPAWFGEDVRAGAARGLPISVLVLVAVAVVLHVVVTRTRFGREVYAIGGNREAAYLSGIPVVARVTTVFALMGLLAAVAGLVFLAKLGSAGPHAGQLLELDAIAACVIGGCSLMGGRGSVPGVLLGALIIGTLDNGMSFLDTPAEWQSVVKGAILVAAVWLDVATQGSDRAA